MNIMITGCSGFLGNELLSLTGHTIFPTTREILDLRDGKKVSEFIDKNKIDVILHAAIKGGRRNRSDTAEDFYENLLSFENLISNANKIKMFINFDSAASYDRRGGVNGPTEKSFPHSIPIDYYGLSKYNISLRVREISNAYNLRIFNCFGFNETDDRMVKGNILRYISKQEIQIHCNKTMDFFYIDDLLKIVQSYVDRIQDDENNKLPKEVNLCYNQKTTLFDIAKIINSLSDYKVDIVIEDRTDQKFDYYGHSEHLDSLGLELKGLQCGIKEMYDKILIGVTNDN